MLSLIYQTETMTHTNTYFAGDTLTIKSGFTVTVRKVISKRYLKVSYGFDSKGNDILSVIDITIHLIK
jgi:hypothetical protein